MDNLENTYLYADTIKLFLLLLKKFSANQKPIYFMKQHIKKIQFLVIALFTIMLSSCSDDLYHQGSKPVTKNKTVSIEEFKRNTGLHNFSKTFKIPKDNTIAYRNADGSYELSDFDINFDYIKQVVVENKISYTFNIVPKIVTSKSIFNLVIYNHDGNWETSILELIPTDENFDKLLAGIDNEFEGSIRQVYSARISGNCYTVAYYVESCTYGDSDACRITCDQCNLCMTLVRYNVCNETEIIQPLYPLSGGGGGGSIGSGSGLSDPSGYIFDPNMYELGSKKYQQAKNAAEFWHGLSVSQQQWVYGNENENNFETYRDIIAYINRPENINNNEAKDFARELVNFVTANNNSPEAIQEISSILDLLKDGKVNGQDVLVAPDVAITDMADYLSCFDTSQPAIITLYADQPISGSKIIISPTLNVGHAFISIRQGTKIKTLGFYPISTLGSALPNPLTPDPRDFLSTPGVFGNDENHTFDVSITTTITSTQLSNIITSTIAVAQSNPQYNLGSMNCTDLAILIFNNSNIEVPSCESPGPWSGQTPGTLGEVIRDLVLPTGSTKNTTGGTAPANSNN